MIDPTPEQGPETRLGSELAAAPVLTVGRGDIVVALGTFALGFAVLAVGMSGLLPASATVALCVNVLVVPACFLLVRKRQGGDLTVPMVLFIATLVSGPVGALGCALMALALRRERPTPARLQSWYGYIAGIVERPRVAQIYDELNSGRLPADPTVRVPRLRPILTSSSIDDQQRVLGVIGRRYHSDFRAVLKRALRDRNGIVRAQAAAIASRLDLEEKTHLWSSTPEPGGEVLPIKSAQRPGLSEA